MLLRILTQPKRRNVIWIYISTGHGGTCGRGKKQPASVVRGSREDLFYTTSCRSAIFGSTALFFEAHYCRGVRASRHLIAVRTVELLLVLYSIAMSNHWTTFVFILLVEKVLGKLVHPLHGLKRMDVVFRAFLHIQQKHVQCLRGLLWTYC